MIFLNAAFTQHFTPDALPTAVRTALGKPLRRAAALTQLALLGAFAAGFAWLGPRRRCRRLDPADRSARWRISADRISTDQGGALLDDACRTLHTLLDHVARHDNEPILLVPDLADPTLASVAVLAADDIRFDDVLNWQGGEQNRMVSVSLPFEAVLEAA